jgi:hypothetical protein
VEQEFSEVRAFRGFSEVASRKLILLVIWKKRPGIPLNIEEG